MERHWDSIGLHQSIVATQALLVVPYGRPRLHTYLVKGRCGFFFFFNDVKRFLSVVILSLCLNQAGLLIAFLVVSNLKEKSMISSLPTVDITPC